MKKQNTLYIQSNGRVAAIDKLNGDVIWEVKLSQYVKGTTFHHATLLLKNDCLYVGVSGILFCLNAMDGSLLWKNELKGWGYYFVSIAGTSSEASSASMTASAATAAVITASS